MVDLVLNANALLVNSVPHAFNSIYVSQMGNNIELRHQYTHKIIVLEQKFDEYSISGTKCTSAGQIITFLTTNAIK